MAKVERAEFRNTTTGYVGAVRLDSRGEARGVAVAPGRACGSARRSRSSPPTRPPGRMATRSCRSPSSIATRTRARSSRRRAPAAGARHRGAADPELDAPGPRYPAEGRLRPGARRPAPGRRRCRRGWLIRAIRAMPAGPPLERAGATRGSRGRRQRLRVVVPRRRVVCGKTRDEPPRRRRWGASECPLA